MRVLRAVLFLLCLLPCVLSAQESEKGNLASGLENVKKVVRGFSAIDTNYIEPQHYNYSVMLQSTFNYDMYWLKSGNGQSLMFSPDVIMKIGPYFGWRWIFLGYTFELKNLDFGLGSTSHKREFSLSLYSSQIGVDLFYRRTGSDYKIRRATMGDGVDTHHLQNIDFDGINVGITGINLYYIFNHNRFSYPAAFSQSTCQKLSCGSWMAGIGYTRNSIELDYNKLKNVVENNVSPAGSVKLDTGLMFNSVKFTDVSASVGYAYNWVFARNWLLCGSMSVALAYKHTRSESEMNNDRGFRLDNVNLDGIGRFGLVYNNTRWYSGLSIIMHTNNYRKSRFEANNVFGSINVYAGYNFGLKKEYRKSKRRKKS